jgi:hypothetical protein
MPGLWIDFYTDNDFIQNETIHAVRQLISLGAIISSPGRPLNVFHRTYLEGSPQNEDNPFWSHYDPFTNSIQILDDGSSDETILDTLHRMLGHATLGHRFAHRPQDLKVESLPELAMSKGWADFVALAIRFADTSRPMPTSHLSYMGEHWETRDPNVKLSPNIEYNVACALWDCYDHGSTHSVVTTR